MSCKCAKPTDEYHGWECTITGGECMFLFPDSKACAEQYGEGPDADIEEEVKDEQKCRVCGCTWNHACEGGCYWVEDDLCSKCAGTEEDDSDKEMDCLACTLNKDNACDDCCRDWDNEEED